MTCHTGNCQEKELILYAPLFASIRNVFIGIDEGASIGEGNAYTVKDPVVFSDLPSLRGRVQTGLDLLIQH